jgi:hypothetical protein
MKKIEDIVDQVLLRLTRPRVGFLWWHETAPESWPENGHLTSVHYMAPGCVFDRPLSPVYRLARLERPENEAPTLQLLAVPRVRPLLLQDILTGLPSSPEGRLVAGCLGHEVPVLLDISHLDGWALWQGAMGKRTVNALKALGEMGCSFIGWEPAGSGRKQSREKSSPGRQGELRLPAPGWYSWAEISTLLEGRKAIRLVPGARLTAEARDRLTQLGIEIREV